MQPLPVLSENCLQNLSSVIIENWSDKRGVSLEKDGGGTEEK